jgi:hypothetical protein
MGGPPPLVEIAALELIESGLKVCKYALADYARCTTRQSQKVLGRLHKAGRIRIDEWALQHSRYLPIYGLGTEPDRMKPNLEREYWKSLEEDEYDD